MGRGCSSVGNEGCASRAGQASTLFPTKVMRRKGVADPPFGAPTPGGNLHREVTEPDSVGDKARYSGAVTYEAEPAPGRL